MINLFAYYQSKGIADSIVKPELCKIISIIYSDNNNFASLSKKGENPFADKASQEEVRLMVHNSKIIELFLSNPAFCESFIEDYMKYCFYNNLQRDHSGDLWDSFYKSSRQRFEVLLGDHRHQSDTYYSRWNRLSGLDAASVFASSREDSQINWEPILNSRILSRRKLDAMSQFDHLILAINTPKFSEKLIEFVEDSDFSKYRGAACRKSIYFSLISSGYMTKKIARKIRSDGSEDTSLESIKLFIANSSIYPNFAEMAAQITDSNYHSVASYLAHNLPINTLAFLAGTKFDDIRQIVVSRMTKNQDSKNA